MRNTIYKKGLVICIMLVLTGSFVIPMIGGETISNEGLLINVNQTDDEIEIIYQINDYNEEPIIIDAIKYSKITLEKEANILVKGMPDLPKISRSIIIPDDKKMDIDIVSLDFKEYHNVLIAPSKGDFDRTIDPNEVPYEFGDVYDQDAWYPGDIAKLREPYIVRDFRGQVVDIFPFQYNPVKNVLRVYDNIKINIYPTGLDIANVINRDSLPEKVESNYKFIYENHFINFGKSSRYNPVSEQGNMLVIVYDSFWDTMVPFVEWKNMKGIPTEMVKVSEIGDANAIKTYIADYYDDYGLAFVLLVGDAQQCPTIPSTQYTYGASDPSYSYIVGNDNYQDLFVGRFSAQNTADLETQVERSIEYEKYPQASADWYHKGMGVASNQGPGDDGEYDDEHMDNIRDDLLAYTYTEVDQIYDPYATSTMVTTALNDGRSIANYCGHGSPTSWGSSGFSNSDVNQLQNDNMLPFICSVACNNGQFDDYDPCFAEAWMRATNNGEPTGAIGFFASTQSQSWNPPMDAEDEIVDILIETYSDNIKHSYGALCFEGTMHMMDEYGSSCYDETDSWTVFGDPSLEVRTDTPTDLSVDHDDMIPIGAETFEIDVIDVENALCAISSNGALLGYGYSDSSGKAVINFFEPIEFMEDGADLVVTAYNKNPYFAALQVGSSYPPEPPTVDGNEMVRINNEYEFTATTTDPENDQIYYMFDWGDGTDSGWLGPVNSGVSMSATHSWSEIGDYEVKVRAKDVEDSRSKWTVCPLHADVPDLSIKMIYGGLFQVTTTIKNEGEVEAENINWEMAIEDGMVILGRESTGIIDYLGPGESQQIKSKLIFGFGEMRVKVNADGTECSDYRSAGGKIWGILVKVNVGGGL